MYGAEGIATRLLATQQPRQANDALPYGGDANGLLPLSRPYSKSWEFRVSTKSVVHLELEGTGYRSREGYTFPMVKRRSNERFGEIQ
jgi:hypothetical protein